MFQSYLTNKFFFPILFVFSVALGCVGVYEYGKFNEKQAIIVKDQINYIATRTKIDAAINNHPSVSANVALSKLLKRQHSKR